jgi:hypothetical protein
MAIKPSGGSVSLLEQIIEDPVSGLTIQIERRSDTVAIIYLYGDLRYGNRELRFECGLYDGGRVYVKAPPKPTFIVAPSATSGAPDEKDGLCR